MTATMRAAVAVGYGKPLEIREYPIPKPGPGELLIKLETCGVCHSDLDVRKGSTAPPESTFPLILGHEGVGIVVERGPGCRVIEEGARVGLPWMHDTCGHCRECLTGQESFCAEHRGHSFDVNGGFAEYAIVKEAYTVIIPEAISSFDAAPLLCAGVTAYGGLQKADLAPGKTCAIFGIGGLGQYGIQLAKAAGATVVAIDANPDKLEIARRLGADHAILAADDPGGKIRDIGGADACINFAPTNRVWDDIVTATNPLGRVVSVAQVPEPVSLNLEWLIYTGIRVTGSSVGTRQELRDLLELGVSLKLAIDIETIPLSGIDEALDRLERGEVDGRQVIDFSLE
ncbi:MAG: zinc-dependent alcohol dehydrogenase [Pseudomonadota bacterium]